MRICGLVLLVLVSAMSLSCVVPQRDSQSVPKSFEDFQIGFNTPVDAGLQQGLERIDLELRQRFEMTGEQTAVGLLDLRTARLAMIHADRGEYAASRLVSPELHKR